MKLSAKYTVFIMALILFFPGCKKVDTSHLTNLNNNVIDVLGHRGSGVTMNNTYPMNTLESIKMGIEEMGADGMEIDAQLTKDNQLMLYHDQELMNMTSFSGMINSYTKDELSHCVINSTFFNNTYTEYHLASLEEVFQRYANYSPSPICYIDLKPYYDTKIFQNNSDFNLVFAQTLYALISKYNRQESIILSSVEVDMLQHLKAISPSLKLIVDNPDFDAAFQQATSLGLFGITINYKNITREQVIKAHDNSLRVILWGVNTKAACIETARLFPDYVETDYVLYMLSLTK